MSLLGAIADWVVGGGPTGLIASGISAYTKYKQTKIELEHERKSWAYEYRMHQLNLEQTRMRLEKGLEIATEVGASSAFAASIAGEAAVATAAMQNDRIPGWLLGLRVGLRPLLTLLLFSGTIMTAFLPLPATVASSALSPAAEGAALTLRQAFMAATGWWFGQRIVSPTDMRKQEY